LNKNFFYIFFLSSERLLGLFLTIFLVNYISASEYVLWGQNIAITTICFQFMLFGSSESIVKYFPVWSDNRKIQGDIILFIISMSILSLIVFALVAFLWPDQLTKLFYGEIYGIEYLIILLISIASEAYLILISSILRSKNQILKSSFYKFSFNFLRAGILIISISIFDFDFYKSLIIYSTFILFYSIVLFFIESKNFNFMPFNFLKNIENFMKILRFGLPTMISTFLVFFLIFFDRFILTRYLDSQALSSYILNSNIALNASFIGTLVGFALFPALSNNLNKNVHSEDILIRYLLFFFGLAIPFIVMIYYFYPYFYYLYGSREFLIDRVTMTMLVIGYSLYGLFMILSYLIYVHKGSKFSVKVTFLGMIINVILNLLLVPIYGVSGAVISLITSFLFIVILTKYISNACVRWDFPWRSLTYILLRSLVLLIPLLMFESMMDNFFNTLIIFLIAMLLYLYIDFKGNISFLRGLIFEKE